MESQPSASSAATVESVGHPKGGQAVEDMVRGHLVRFVDRKGRPHWINAFLVMEVEAVGDGDCRIALIGAQWGGLECPLTPDQAAGRLMQARIWFSNPAGALAAGVGALREIAAALFAASQKKPVGADVAKESASNEKAPRAGKRRR